jgi:hypothetical protein
MSGRRLAVGLLVGATACVTRVVAHEALFPARPDWRSCVRGRLEGMGFVVIAADSLRPLRARRRSLRVSVAGEALPRVANDTARPTQLHVSMSGVDRTALVDSLVIYCALPQLP